MSALKATQAEKPGDANGDEYAEQRRRGKVPRRVIHCSDGVIEEYSTDEEEEDEDAADEADRKQVGRGDRKSAVDPKSLRWVPWVMYYSWFAGSRVLGYCDFLGEKLAWALGITSPKYFYEIEDFKREQEEERERKEKQDEEMKGWTQVSGDGGLATPVTQAQAAGVDN